MFRKEKREVEEQARKEFEQAYDFDSNDPRFGLSKQELRGPKMSRRSVMRLLAAAGALTMVDVLAACAPGGAAAPAAPAQEGEASEEAAAQMGGELVAGWAGTGEAGEAFGLPQVLINNAAANFPVPAEDMSANAWRTVVDITLNGTFFCATGVRPPPPRGRVPPAPSSTSGRPTRGRGGPGFAHSAAAKAGVKNMVETLAVEWGPCGIQVNGLVPRAVPPRRHDRRHQGQPRPHPREGRLPAGAAGGAGARARVGRHLPRIALRPIHQRAHVGGRRSQLAAAHRSPTRRSSRCATRWAEARSSPRSTKGDDADRHRHPAPASLRPPLPRLSAVGLRPPSAGSSRTGRRTGSWWRSRRPAHARS